MKIKKAFSFDEEKDALEIMQTNVSENPIDYAKMYLVAKYLRKNMGYGAIRLEKKLIEFCLERDPLFNPVIEAQYIKKWVKAAMNFGLRKTDIIFLSDKEIKFLNSIENSRDRRVLYSTLVLAKAIYQKANRTSSYYYINYSNILDVPRLAQLPKLSEIAVCKIYYKYKEHFTFYSPNKELIRINFADHQGEKTVQISDLDNIMKTYQEIFGKPKFYCENCGKEIIRTSGNKKTCDDCSKARRREKQKLLMRKRRGLKKE